MGKRYHWKKDNNNLSAKEEIDQNEIQVSSEDVLVIAEDRLSELPDSLILYILSLINYKTDYYYYKKDDTFILKKLIRTCVLSKRWRFLWTKISEIELYESSEDMGKIKRYVNFVGRVLNMCSENYLHRFSVGFHYSQSFAPYLNSWLQIAVERNVKDISLKYFSDSWRSWRRICYGLPRVLYSHSSLTTLSISQWAMTRRETINWPSLKSLSITDVDISNCVMERILLGCPILEVLCLKQCSGFTCLNIFSPTFTKLEFEASTDETHRPSFEYIDDIDISAPYTIDISAPYARELKLKWDPNITQLRLRDVTSLVLASLEFYEVPSITNHMIELLQSLRCVKELELGGDCIMPLSELDGLNIPPSMRRCLTLNIRNKESFHGVLWILKSSPYLESLTIQGYCSCFEDVLEESISEKDIPEQIVKYIENIDLVFHHLKTINITCECNEPMMIVAQVFLKSSYVLQKMNLFYYSYSYYDVGCEELTKTALALPKASPDAVVTVTKRPEYRY